MVACCWLRDPCEIEAERVMSAAREESSSFAHVKKLERAVLQAVVDPGAGTMQVRSCCFYMVRVISTW